MASPSPIYASPRRPPREKSKETREATIEMLDDEEPMKENNKPSVSFAVTETHHWPSSSSTRHGRSMERSPFTSLPTRNMYRVTARSSSAHPTQSRPKIQLMFDIPKREHSASPSHSSSSLLSFHSLAKRPIISIQQCLPLAMPSDDRMDHTRIQELEHENGALLKRITELEQLRISQQKKFSDENGRLRRELDETKAYVDRSDVQTEQQYSELSNRIEEMMMMLEEREKALNAVRQALHDMTVEEEKRTIHEKALEATNTRQRDVIESIREELDQTRCRLEEMEKERDAYRNHAASTLQRLEANQEEFSTRLRILQAERDFLKSQTGQTEEHLQKIAELEKRAKSLEETNRAREILIQHLQLEKSVSGDGFDVPDNLPLIRSLIFNNDSQRVRLLGPLSHALGFDDEEEAKAKSSLRAKVLTA